MDTDEKAAFAIMIFLVFLLVIAGIQEREKLGSRVDAPERIEAIQSDINKKIVDAIVLGSKKGCDL